mgnify:CR=1 FL=1
MLTDVGGQEFGLVDQASELLLVEYMVDAERVLRPEEYEFFKVAADSQWTVTEKAKMLGISRKGYYEWLRRIEVRVGCG